MTTETTRRRDRLWNLLPEFHRIKDAEAGYPLRGLLGAIGTEFARVESDIEELWNDQFIETCRPWVIPYIAELLGVEPIYEVEGTARADVGLTTSFRRRQGTMPMLEDLAESVTGWETVVVELFQRLSWNQHLNHLDADRTTIDLKAPGPLQLLDGPFDHHEHTVDIRPPSTAVARPNLNDVAFFVHRLIGDEFSRVQPRPAGPASGEWRFFLHPTGVNTPLFHRFDDDVDRDRRIDEDETHSVIRTGWLAGHLADRPGASSSVIEIRTGELVLTGDDRDESVGWLEVQCADLSAWRQPPPGKLYLDPRLGRIALAPEDRAAELDGDLEATFGSGAPGPIGALGKPRATSEVYETLEAPVPRPDDADPEEWELLTVGVGGDHMTISDAVADWSGEDAVIRILDSRTYEESVGFIPRAGCHLVIQAADGERPFLLGDIRLVGGGEEPPIDDRMRLTVDGVHIAGHLRVTAAAAVESIDVLHCSIWPTEESEDGAQPSTDRGIQLLGSVNSLFVAQSSVRGIETTSATDLLTVNDSIVDGHGAAAIAGEGGVRSGPVTRLARTTLLGSVFVRELHATDTIFIGPVVSRRTQTGCVRYSFVPLLGNGGTTPRTPRRYRCQPDLALADARELLERTLSEAEQRTVQLSVTPQFASLDPFAPAYTTLLPDTPQEILRGASDGLEMGAWYFRQNPRRIDNLRRRLADYLPVGLTPEIVYVN
jgi:hypothetical protein